MKVTNEKTENRQVYLTVEMEPAEMVEPLEASYRRLVKKASIPGFRKGKATRAVVERYLGRQSLLEEALKEVVPHAYEEALKEQAIKPFAQPDIEITQADPIKFKAVVPLPPTIELGDYLNIRLTPEPVDNTEDKVKDVVEELRHQHATWEPVERPIAFNDLVVINVDSEIEEKPFIKKLGIQYQVFKDSIAPAPGFAEQLIGMKKEEEKEFKLKLPPDYQRAELAGKEASFKVKAAEVKEEKLPELNDAFAKMVSPNFTNLDALREKVAANLKLRAEEKARMDFEERVVKELIDKSKADYPPVVVEMEINRILNERARQLQVTGKSLEEYLKSLKKTEAELREELRPLATKNVIASLVVGKVAEAEKIEVSDAEITAELEGMTKNTAEDKKEEFRKLLDTPRTRESIKQSLMMRKAVERLVAVAESTEETKTEVKEEKK